MLISIVIPVYNSSVLPELARRIDAVFTNLTPQHEIIFVDDFSTSADVWPTLTRLASERQSVRAVQLTRNFGQHAATLCGLKESRGDFAITMDDDLQHNPEDIPKFLNLTDFDIVVAQFKNKKHHLFKRLTSRIKGVFDQIIIDKPKEIQLSSYRMVSRTVVEGMQSIITPHPFIPSLMFHVSKNVAGLELEHRQRQGARSGYTFWKLFRVFTNLIINNSSVLLRVVGFLGTSLAFVSFVIALVTIYRKLMYGTALQGWSSLFAALLLIGGLLLFSVGLIGEYLIRIIETSEAKPTFFVRRRAGFEPKKKMVASSQVEVAGS
jgi:dolichol-phosphate mannosyltransferase/undecaprenyl-phosphate 4-deoxy-4-formamido-L-arabinose transferase